MKIPYNILIQIKMSVRPYFKGFTLIFSSITVENRIIHQKRQKGNERKQEMR